MDFDELQAWHVEADRLLKLTPTCPWLGGR